jgi:hypothetical protein
MSGPEKKNDAMDRMRWVDALKQWNAGSGKWCIPRKGTEDYDAVRTIMGPKAEKEKKVKAEKAPKEAKAPKASLKDMAAAVGVPMKTMKSAAADYYKRVDNADASTRALLIERMPAQLRAGWEKHQASKEPAAPVVRRVLKKKPVMVAPEAPAAPAPAPTRSLSLEEKRVLDNLYRDLSDRNGMYWQDPNSKKLKHPIEIESMVVNMVTKKYPSKPFPQYAEEITIARLKDTLKKNKKYPEIMKKAEKDLKHVEETQRVNLGWEMDSQDSDAYYAHLEKTKAEDTLSTLKKWAEKNDINLY